MINPAFIVDGKTEQRIIQKICPGQPVRRLNCNGKDVSYDVAAKYAATHIRLLKKYYPIIIVFDREKRHDTSTEVAKKLLDAIQKQGIQEVSIYIGVPDFMIENWMLADINSINSYYSLSPSSMQSSFEGTNGTSKIRSLIGNMKYYKAKDGPDIFSKCNISKIYRNSNSFKIFFEILKNINCNWVTSFCPDAEH